MKPQGHIEGMTAILAVSCVTWQYFVYPCISHREYLCPDVFKYLVTSKEVFLSFYFCVLISILVGCCACALNYNPVHGQSNILPFLAIYLYLISWLNIITIIISSIIERMHRSIRLHMGLNVIVAPKVIT